MFSVIMDQNILSNVIVDGLDTIVNDVDVVVDGTADGQNSNEEKTFYSSVNVYKDVSVDTSSSTLNGD